jgi:POT family proton-dependent oligopeptide transporter
VVGTLGQRFDWHIGFGAAGIGMTFGLVQYVLGRNRLRPALERLQAASAPAGSGKSAAPRRPFAAAEWKPIAAIGVFFAFSVLFWGAYEQAGSSLNLFADRFTRLSAFGFKLESSWFQSLPAVFVILLAPAFAWLWVRLGRREPSSPAKFSLGLLFVSLSFLLLIPAAAIAQGQGTRVSPAWLFGVYLLQVMGELCLSPVGLSVVTKLAPPRIVGSMMGIWFLSLAFGNKLGGWVAGFFTAVPLPQLFGTVFGVAGGAALILALVVKPVRRLMGSVH